MRTIVVPIDWDNTLSADLVQGVLAALPCIVESDPELRRAELTTRLPAMTFSESYERYDQALTKAENLAGHFLRQLTPYFEAEGYVYPAVPVLTLLRTLPDAWVIGLAPPSEEAR